MPSNRRKITRTRTAVESWQIEFLLYGRAKHSSIPDRESIRPFCYFDALGGCLADRKVWLPLWHELKAELLPQWRKDHPGVPCWAEREIGKAMLG